MPQRIDSVAVAIEFVVGPAQIVLDQFVIRFYSHRLFIGFDCRVVLMKIVAIDVTQSSVSGGIIRIETNRFFVGGYGFCKLTIRLQRFFGHTLAKFDIRIGQLDLGLRVVWLEPNGLLCGINSG